MGKSQFKKKAAAKARRHNPVRVPDAHLGNGISAAAEHVEKGKEQAMLPIMTKASNKTFLLFRCIVCAFSHRMRSLHRTCWYLLLTMPTQL